MELDTQNISHATSNACNTNTIQSNQGKTENGQLVETNDNPSTGVTNNKGGGNITSSQNTGGQKVQYHSQKEALAEAKINFHAKFNKENGKAEIGSFLENFFAAAMLPKLGGGKTESIRSREQRLSSKFGKEGVKFRNDAMDTMSKTLNGGNSFSDRIKNVLTKLLHSIGIYSDAKVSAHEQKSFEKNNTKVFSELRKEVFGNEEGKKFLNEFVTKNCDNSEVMSGMFQVLYGMDKKQADFFGKSFAGVDLTKENVEESKFFQRLKGKMEMPEYMKLCRVMNREKDLSVLVKCFSFTGS